MYTILYFLMTFCAFSTLHTAESEDNAPIVVRLATDTQLMPIYLAPMQNEQEGFSADYVRSLEKVLRFDLDHNAMTYVAQSSPEKERLNSTMGYDYKGDLSAWMNQNVYFVIKTRIKDKKLGARLLLINSNGIKTVDGIELTGNLKDDRRAVHSLADLIHKALFGKDGIASTRFLYTVKTQNPSTKKWISEVVEADYDGGNARQITQSGGYCVTPAYIPPREGYISRSFVFVSYKIGQPKIYFGSLDDSQMQRFSLLKGNQLMPTVSRQRDKVAFICDTTGNPDLFIQDFDPEKGAMGKPRQIFSTHRATQGTPTFSPDGKKIAFVSNKDGSPRIFVMDIPTPGMKLADIKAKMISKANRENSAPAWSPDGKKIAFCAMTKGVRQIWVYDIESNSERQLTQGSGNKENPTWAPNSLHIIFNSSDAGASELYLINLNQREVTKISHGPGEKHFPAWEIRS